MINITEYQKLTTLKHILYKIKRYNDTHYQLISISKMNIFYEIELSIKYERGSSQSKLNKRLWTKIRRGWNR